jgi:hypothetical protein
VELTGYPIDKIGEYPISKAELTVFKSQQFVVAGPFIMHLSDRFFSKLMSCMMGKWH